ncbi:acetylornithine deacetylase [Aurantimonas sp. VKM B-3413]|uniref:acetylornithine deacetylase n=1 Tax=Aurantimonas sp. VKM B-3413 TaxID=2779401 RepID=UPI001E5F3B6C|nr:acetylornithine deacetylase [Aurantimonas sp. VKM B-3413]MCB8836339.1 acetylornithine deacetylase [Aurantimonas sp. VKM B-3413]
MLGKLVGFPTVSSQSNLPLIDFAADYLASHGIVSHRVPNADGGKSNLWATIGPDVPGGVVLSGHTDVVPAEGQPWTSDPFTLTARGDRLYGRGTTDMKGFLAITLALAPEMAAAGLQRPIHLALSYDEEVGCLGAPSMIREMRETIAPPQAVIVGEPTKMQVVTGHKGVMGLEVHVRGKPVHSSVVHEGVSAIMVAARLITWLSERMETNRLAAGNAGGDSLFVPPYTTLHSGRIEGGTAHNITAKDCRFTVDIRTLPSERSGDYLAEFQAFAASLESEMQRVDPASGIDIVRRSDTPACRREVQGEAEALARALTGDNAEHAVAYGTEAGQFQDEAFSTVVCGPGDMEQGHAPDEFITREQLAAGEAFQRRLIERLKN